MKIKTILLAEDETIIAMDIKNILERNGFKDVTMLADGKSLLDKAIIEGGDLIITDILFKKEIDGIEAVEEIWEEIDIPVIFISGMEINLAKKLTLSNYQFLKKPFNEKELLEAVYRSLNNP